MRSSSAPQPTPEGPGSVSGAPSLPAGFKVTLLERRNLSARFFIVEPERSQLIELARLVDVGRLRVEVAEVFNLRDFAVAYEFARTTRRRGKVVVQVAAAEPKLIEQAVGATAG